MGCQCSDKQAPKRYVLTTPDGKTVTYASKTEAEMAKARKGGYIRVQ